jgi:N6-adenosine-specific RNA methylase IME4
MGEALEFHPLANLFPLIEGQAFDDLVADIRANGLRDKVVMYEGKILDGRNRYRAAVAAELIDPSGETDMGDWDPRFFRHHQPRKDGDALAFVLSLNLHRRHLTTSQRAMIGAEIAGMKRGRPGDNPQSCGITAQEAAERLKVAPRSIEMARRVREHGTDELVDAVKAGTVTVAAASDLATLPKDQQLAALRSADADVLYKVLAEQRARKQAAKRERRDEREVQLGERIASGNAALVAAGAAGLVYPVILADPEWRFEPRSRETGMDRAPENHYPTTPTAEIRKRPVAQIAARDAVLFLWATAPMLPDAFAVMADWGFTYRTHAIWVKRRPGNARGPGYWLTGEHEILMLGTRGTPPAPAQGAQWPSVFIAPVGSHSAKPERAYELIEAYFPNLPKIELNARARRPGWDVWGAEAPEAEPAAPMGRPVAAELAGWAAEVRCVDLPAWPVRRVS